MQPMTFTVSIYYVRSPIARLVKRWPTDVAVLGSSPALADDYFNRKRGSIARSFLLLPPIVPK